MPITESHREAKRRYLLKHGDRIRAKRREDRAKNPDIHNKRAAEWRKNNPDKVKAYRQANQHKYKGSAEVVKRAQKKYREKNRDRVLQMTRDWHAKNKDARREYRRKRLSEYAAHSAKRRAKTLQAMPSWCELTVIEGMYALAKVLSEETGISYTIDHIVPLQSPTVCGLHCLANLQIMEMSHNQRKGNRHWPDMP